MKFSILNTLMIVAVFLSLIALPVGDALMSNGYPLFGIFTQLGGGIGIINTIAILSATFLFGDRVAV